MLDQYKKRMVANHINIHKHLQSKSAVDNVCFISAGVCCSVNNVNEVSGDPFYGDARLYGTRVKNADNDGKDVRPIICHSLAHTHISTLEKNGKRDEIRSRVSNRQ